MTPNLSAALASWLAWGVTVYGCKSWQGVHSDCAEQASVKR